MQVEGRETNEQLENTNEMFIMRWQLKLKKYCLTFPQIVTPRIKRDYFYFFYHSMHFLLEVPSINVSNLQYSVGILVETYLSICLGRVKDDAQLAEHAVSLELEMVFAQLTEYVILTLLETYLGAFSSNSAHTSLILINENVSSVILLGTNFQFRNVSDILRSSHRT